MSTKKTNIPEKDSLGERFCLVRSESGLTMSKFGDSIKVSGGYINDIEKGIKTNVGTGVILLVCKIYDLNFPWLLTGHGNKRYPSKIQNIHGDDKETKSSGEDNFMLFKVIQELGYLQQELVNVKRRLEKLESLMPGQQKKNQPNN